MGDRDEGHHSGPGGIKQGRVVGCNDDIDTPLLAQNTQQVMKNRYDSKVSLTGLMEPPMIGLMEPQKPSRFNSWT